MRRILKSRPAIMMLVLLVGSPAGCASVVTGTRDGAADPRDAAADSLDGIDTTPIVGVTTGRNSTCARRASGTAVCWGGSFPGDGCGGQCPARLAPTRSVTDLADATRLAAGSYHSCALRMTGDVVCWGDNQTAELGNRTVGSRSAVPVPVLGLANAMFLAAGHNYSCALRAPGTVLCWGNDDTGAVSGVPGTLLGNVWEARVVEGLPDDLIDLATGDTHACAVEASGSVWCWGRNDSGKNGGIGEALMRVNGGDDAVQVAAGSVHTCARRRTGHVVCWGTNDAGQLGTGAQSGATPPTEVAGLDDATAIAAGGLHTCAIRAAGAVVCWGNNGSGQLGDGTTTARPAPTAVLDVANAADIDCGDQHTCIVTNEGRVMCWGLNDGGQIGDGTRTTRTLAVRVAGL